jgi:hypothetical protein
MKELIFATSRLGSINATNITYQNPHSSSPPKAENRLSPPPTASLTSLESSHPPSGPLPTIWPRQTQTTHPTLATLHNKIKRMIPLLGFGSHSIVSSEGNFATPLTLGSVNIELQPVIVKPTSAVVPSAPTLSSQDETMETESVRTRQNKIPPPRRDNTVQYFYLTFRILALSFRKMNILYILSNFEPCSSLFKYLQNVEERVSRNKRKVSSSDHYTAKKRKADLVPEDLEEEAQTTTKRRKKVNEKKRKNPEIIESDNEDEAHIKKRKTIRNQSKRTNKKSLTSSQKSTKSLKKTPNNKLTEQTRSSSTTKINSMHSPSLSKSDKETQSQSNFVSSEIKSKEPNSENTNVIQSRKNSSQENKDSKAQQQQQQQPQQPQTTKTAESSVHSSNASKNISSGSTTSNSTKKTPSLESSPLKEDSSSEIDTKHSKLLNSVQFTEDLPKVDVSILSSQATPTTKQRRVAFASSNSNSSKQPYLRTRKQEQVILPEEEEDKRVQSLLEAAAKTPLKKRNSKRELDSVRS